MTKRYRKRIRIAKAADIFGISKPTFLSRVRAGEYSVQLIQPKPGSKSPILCWEAEIDALAKREGIL